MTTVADFFRPLPDVLDLIPIMRQAKSLLEAGWAASLEVDHWSRFTLGHDAPALTIHFRKPDQEALVLHSNWKDFINDGLIRLKVRAQDPEQESDRFSLSLDTAFTPAEEVAGDGFFNSVLFDFIRASELGKDETISTLMKGRSIVTLDRETFKYFECQELIDAAIRGRAIELKDDLGYSMNEAWSILVAAMARYIDRRFSVSLRKQRGML